MVLPFAGKGDTNDDGLDNIYIFKRKSTEKNYNPERNSHLSSCFSRVRRM
jgi:hypothetical protein